MKSISTSTIDILADEPTSSSHATSASTPDQSLSPTLEILFEDNPSLEPRTSSAGRTPPDHSFPQHEELQIRKLEVDIMHEVENQGFEDGFQHPSENLIFEYMNRYPALTKRWLQQTFLRNYRHPEIIIAILRTITHFDISNIDPECKILSVAALSHKNSEIREAAISVFEAWGTPDAIDYLQNYNENKPWITQYRDKVIQELKEKHAIRR